ncbi:YciI family protein [Pseudoalteromonas sp. CO348]|uniref:YciI family protein n=1 Tax=Pseudoalteromonas TaxID=53246 RepID=UPI0005F9E8B6|nr:MULTISPECIES: YciI family protein [Pseudoalteromonas]KJZ03749.1 dehydrogenase [Pseudoalteromonas piscicida]MCG7539844.1 YciI family protein [Pseudoalteromonas sp. OF7H-1]MCG9767718.1 YciI family protein [Pseudoalteromonas piscicida]QUI63624.1 YciI family protein [Pseudoalteromonas sp. A22]QZO11342.1 YciI family protein [Pseudoalteromonas piscicida]
MKYVALVYYDEQAMEKLSQDEWDALNRECIACGESLKEREQMIGGNALLSTQSATTLRIRAGKVDITDGPFAETKEQLAGFYLLDVKDLNEAIQAASKIPPARYGSIEIRPVRELQDENNVSYEAQRRE